MRQAWQALPHNYHAPAIYCKASPLLLQVGSGRDDYSHAYYECGTWWESLVIRTTRPATPRAHSHT
eukprot:4877556-Pleurochrysis_carterae.AAC.1